MQVTDEMVDRFLSWKLPADFAPDCGISFDGSDRSPFNPRSLSKEWPVGTNLLTAAQARDMLEHVLAEQDAPSPLDAPKQSLERDRALLREALEGLMWRFEDDDSDPHAPKETAPDILAARAALRRIR